MDAFGIYIGILAGDMLQETNNFLARIYLHTYP